MTRRRNFVVVSVVFMFLLAFLVIDVQSAFAASNGYTMKVNYQILGNGSPTPPTITYVPQGTSTAITIPLTSTIQTLCVKKNTYWEVKPNILISLNPSERWISTQTLSGTTPNNGGSITKTFSFQQQFKLIVTSPKDTPSGTGWYNSGSKAYAQLPQGTVQGSSGTRFIFTGWSGPDVSGSNLKSNAITMTKPMEATANWKTQYQVCFNVNPYNSGTTSPSGTNWYDKGQTINIVATKKDSFTFSSWTKPASITITGGATASATINGPGTITANFAKPKDTYLTVSAYPKTVDKIGDEITSISGRLTSYGQGVAGKLITLKVNSGNGDNPVGTVTTNAQGIYKFDWNPNDQLPNGLYIIKASFAGDSNYKPSNAATSCRGDVAVVPEYALGALASLAACFAAFLIIKKPLVNLRLK